MMRCLYNFLMAFTFLFICKKTGAQVQKETDFKKTCNKVIQCVTKNNLAGLNSLVDTKQGVFIVYRPDAMDAYSNVKKLENEHPFRFEYYNIQESDLEKLKMEYGKPSDYNCDVSQENEDAWSKRGYFADTVKKYFPVSAVIFFRVKNREERISRKKPDAIRSVERNSRKVVFTGTRGDGIIFYLRYYNGKWRVSIIDRLTTDCSA